MKLEVLKPRINKRYERFEQLLRDRDARRASASPAPTDSPSHKHQEPNHQAIHKRYLSDPAVANNTETLAAGDNRDLAVKLAHKEIRRRATARKATIQAGIPEKVEQERRTAGVWGDWEEAFTKEDTLSIQMQSVRSQVNGSSTGEDRPFESQRSNYHYPGVPKHSPYSSWKTMPCPSNKHDDYSIHSKPKTLRAPGLPSKDLHRPLQNLEELPPRPEKGDYAHSHASSSTVADSVPQDLKPSTFTFKPSAYLENGTPLRTIFLPPDLRHRFSSIALPNTRANLETCGILCGTLVSNALFVSKLVIPDQESTSDTCETINESALFDYVDGEDLMVLGWIHTHPTQTCFMSSRDLHTHGGYQVMMPESIAIVCAPSKGDWGVFRLTDPPGMKTVLNCTQTGLFHPHAESNIYTDALRPGHVYEAKGLEFDVVDLRPQ